MVLVLCISSDDALYNFMNMLYIILRVIQDFKYSYFQRGIITFKMLVEFLSLFFCLLSDDALFLFKDSRKYLKRFLSY